MLVEVVETRRTVAFRVARELLLEMALVARREFDPTDNLILLGVSQANVRQIVAQPEQQRRYAYAHTNPPDELRRPISAAALSRALDLPMETVRRRVARLTELGRIKATPQGLIVPGGLLAGDDHLEVIGRVEAALRRAYRGLADARFFDPGEHPATPSGDGKPATRAAARLAGDFYLRMLAAFGPCCRDPMEAMIVLALLEDGGDGASRAPRRPSAIARSFGSSAETVRRRLNRLVDSGLCRRAGPGYVIPQEVIDATLLPALAEASEMNLRRLYRQLAALW
jgi:DNA-binding Lrp family transcriptional regulator